MFDIRNIAIIAHVDHGKTTLVDALLKQSDTFREKELQGSTIMDSNELERERGITIFSKNAAVMYRGVKINIVDTPGHADFGGEVERIMNLVDGVLLLVDAKEGPMPQTKFVLKKAIAAGHRVIVVINKIDKKDARPDFVLNKTFDLFVELGASDRQTDFPVLYACAKQGKAGFENNLGAMKNVEAIFETVVKEIPAPQADAGGPLQVSVANVSYDNYKGRIAIGRVVRGVFKPGVVAWINRAGKVTPAKITNIMTFDGLSRIEAAEALAGDIVAFAGIDEINIGETIADPKNPEALPVTAIEEPTVKITLGINTSPLAGREGQYCTTRQIKERLDLELQNDVALKVEPGVSAEHYVVSGRGELHLAILIEKMRREGYEMQVSRPQVIFRDIAGVKSEPFEAVSIEAPEEFAGVVIEQMGVRRAEMKDMKVENKIVYLEFEAPTRGLIGYRTDFLTDTKGQGIMNSLFLDYRPLTGEINSGAHGSLIASEAGVTNTYGLYYTQERGQLFLGPGVEVYVGMIVGQNAKDEDIEVNVCREKELSNMRSKGEGEGKRLDTAQEMSLEKALEYIGEDELVEVTPKSIRLRKLYLTAVERKRMKK
ncbi:translational GTPase TypA [Candidatus Uhrbacteria bacterium]|nr:translational GTPase TypA [Candidatus Uhrbacteria bacterium]